MLDSKKLPKTDVDYLDREATDAPSSDVDAVRDLLREEAGLDKDATHIEVVDESGESQLVRVNSIGSVSLKNAVVVHSGSWQDPSSK